MCPKAFPMIFQEINQEINLQHFHGTASSQFDVATENPTIVKATLLDEDLSMQIL